MTPLPQFPDEPWVGVGLGGPHLPMALEATQALLDQPECSSPSDFNAPKDGELTPTPASVGWMRQPSISRAL